MLEREVNPTPDHAEVVVSTVNHIPAEVINPADVPGDANFHTAAEVAHNLGLAVAMLGYESATGSRNNTVALTATEDSAETAESIRSETGASDRIPERQCAQRLTNRSAVIGFGKHESAGSWHAGEVELGAFRIENSTLESNSEVFVPEVLGIYTAAPGVIRLQVTITPVVTKEKSWRADMALFGPSESVCAPEAYIKFVFSVETLFRLNRRLSHFFACVFSPRQRQRSRAREHNKAQRHLLHLFLLFG
jgi:hypothetical protein